MLLPMLWLLGSTYTVPQSAADLRLPAQTVLQVAVVRPLAAATASAGDPLYLQTTFPVQMDGRVLVPAGTYVAGELTGVVKPTRRRSQALLEVRAEALIFADGYTVQLSHEPPSLTVLTVRASRGMTCCWTMARSSG